MRFSVSFEYMRNTKKGARNEYLYLFKKRP